MNTRSNSNFEPHNRRTHLRRRLTRRRQTREETRLEGPPASFPAHTSHTRSHFHTRAAWLSTQWAYVRPAFPVDEIRKAFEPKVCVEIGDAADSLVQTAKARTAPRVSGAWFLGQAQHDLSNDDDTRTDTDTGRHRHAKAQRGRETEKDIQNDRDIDRDTETETETDRHTDIQTYRHTQPAP